MTHIDGIHLVNTFKEKINEKGEQTVEAERGCRTSVHFEWVLPKGTKCFNIRTALTKAMNVTKIVDQSVYLVDVNNNTWKTLEAYPTGKDFNKAFNVQQVYERRKPMRVKLFAKVVTKLCLNTIKFEQTVYAYLKKRNLYINPDFFKCND